MKRTGFKTCIIVLLIITTVLFSSCGKQQKEDTVESAPAESENNEQKTQMEKEKPAPAPDSGTEENGSPGIFGNDIKKAVIGNWALKEITTNGETQTIEDMDNPSLIYTFTKDSITIYLKYDTDKVHTSSSAYKWIDNNRIEITNQGDEEDEDDITIST